MAGQEVKRKQPRREAQIGGLGPTWLRRSQLAEGSRNEFGANEALAWFAAQGLLSQTSDHNGWVYSMTFRTPGSLSSSASVAPGISAHRTVRH